MDTSNMPAIIRGDGSHPTTWGTLSTAVLPVSGNVVCLEATLAAIADAVPAAVELAEVLPHLRAAALRDADAQTVRDDADQQLLLLVYQVREGEGTWWQLVGHLPGNKRPLPTSVDAFAWPTQAHHPLHPMKVVTPTSPESPVDLLDYELAELPAPDLIIDDIVSRIPRRGISSAALRHLTRYADANELTIDAQFAPVTWSTGVDVEWVAAWYQRAGFTVPDGTWDIGARMTRPPTTR